jgi:hypothetical protein
LRSIENVQGAGYGDYFDARGYGSADRSSAVGPTGCHPTVKPRRNSRSLIAQGATMTDMALQGSLEPALPSPTRPNLDKDFNPIAAIMLSAFLFWCFSQIF